MSKRIKTASSRILVQVREGMPNVLAEFELPLHTTEPLDPSDPDTIKGAKLVHNVDNRDLIAGLAQAQRKLVQDLRNGGDLAANEAWLNELHKWVMSE